MLIPGGSAGLRGGVSAGSPFPWLPDTSVREREVRESPWHRAQTRLKRGGFAVPGRLRDLVPVGRQDAQVGLRPSESSLP